MHCEGDNVDGMLALFASGLRASGWNVRGLIQQPRVPGQEKLMVLADVEDASARYNISQLLGPDSRSCSLDAAGVAAASIVLRRALSEGADLVLANRFGTLEAAGGGLATEMLALMGASTPLLTVVDRRYLAPWREFTGGLGAELAPRMEALHDWFADLRRQKSAA